MLGKNMSLAIIDSMPVYVYMDESGSPGKAQYENEYFLVAAVFVNSIDQVVAIQDSTGEWRPKSLII